jgi:hypothetical protein
MGARADGGAGISEVDLTALAALQSQFSKCMVRSRCPTCSVGGFRFEYFSFCPFDAAFQAASGAGSGQPACTHSVGRVA